MTIYEEAAAAGFTDALTVKAVAEATQAAVLVAGDVARQSRRSIRTQRVQVKRQVCRDMGISLLALLLNAVLSRLINWMIEKYMEKYTSGQMPTTYLSAAAVPVSFDELPWGWRLAEKLNVI